MRNLLFVLFQLIALGCYAQLEFNVNKSFETVTKNLERNDYSFKVDTLEDNVIQVLVKPKSELITAQWIFFKDNLCYKEFFLSKEDEFIYFIFDLINDNGAVQAEDNPKIFYAKQTSDGADIYIEFDNTLFDRPSVHIVLINN